ncbi:MAG TPA: hypothetical protein VHG91_03290 [Longimicrobium sp.]|nr:hypothetical protein [Longimicrobium sp.]
MPKLTLNLDALHVESFSLAARSAEQEAARDGFYASGAQACFTAKTCASGGAVCCA